MFRIVLCIALLLAAAVAFETYGLSKSRSGQDLIAAGKRRKFFLDIYTVGLYTNDASATSKGASIKKAKDLDKLAEISTLFGPGLTFVLKFDRAVGTEQMVSSFSDALSGVKDKNAVEAFKDVLKKAVGDKGLKLQDELAFAYSGDRVDVSLNSKNVGSVTSKELKTKLANVYVGPSSVSPELHEVLKKRFVKK